MTQPSTLNQKHPLTANTPLCSLCPVLSIDVCFGAPKNIFTHHKVLYLMMTTIMEIYQTGLSFTFFYWYFIWQPQQRAYLQLPSHLVQVGQIQIWSFLFKIMTLFFVQEQFLQFSPASSLRWNHYQLNHLCRQMSTMEEKTVMF